MRFRFTSLSEWLDQLATIGMPKKTDQDRLDAALCLLIAIRWRLGAREESIVVGDLHTGYMVAPVSVEVNERLEVNHAKRVPRFQTPV
jgi:predicted RNase H-like nuclease